jgi:hypothetical protein
MLVDNSDWTFGRLTALAYIFLTSKWPTHTRRPTNEWLRKVTTRDRSEGALRVMDDCALRAILGHPMVLKVFQLQEGDFWIATEAELQRDPATAVIRRRRPPGRIYMTDGDKRIIVDENGGVLDGWASPRGRRPKSGTPPSKSGTPPSSIPTQAAPVRRRFRWQLGLTNQHLG